VTPAEAVTTRRVASAVPRLTRRSERINRHVERVLVAGHPELRERSRIGLRRAYGCPRRPVRHRASLPEHQEFFFELTPSDRLTYGRPHDPTGPTSRVQNESGEARRTARSRCWSRCGTAGRSSHVGATSSDGVEEPDDRLAVATPALDPMIHDHMNATLPRRAGAYSSFINGLAP